MQKKQNGFTLVELGMVLVVIGLITGAIFNYMSHSTKKENDFLTINKQQKIALALSNFAQSHGYLPCPSRTTSGSGTTDSPSIGEAARRCDSTTAHAQRYGIVPFKTLGLSQSDIIDGYGNPFSYAVSRSANHIPTINPVHKSETKLETYPACNDRPSEGEIDHIAYIPCDGRVDHPSAEECLTDTSPAFQTKIETIFGYMTARAMNGPMINFAGDDFCLIMNWWTYHPTSGRTQDVPGLLCIGKGHLHPPL